MATVRVSVKNTFLDLEAEQTDTNFSSRVNRRAFSSEPTCSRTAPLMPLEQITIDRLNLLLEGTVPPTLPPQQKPASEAPKALLSKLKPVLSNSSVSTMCPDDSDDLDFEDGMNQVIQLEDCVSHHAGAQYAGQGSMNSIAPDGWDCQGEAAQDERVAPQLVHKGGSSSRSRYVGVPSADEFTHFSVPRTLNFAEEFAKSVPEALPTTMMIRNIPNRYTQQELIKEMESLGFTGSFDFLYAPIDFGTMGNVGYAFVNFVSGEWASRCHRDLNGHLFRKHQRRTREKVAVVSVAHLQGLEANIRHYEKAAVTGRSRSKKCGPVIMTNLSAALM